MRYRAKLCVAVASVLAPVLLVACAGPNPCDPIAKAGWTCNLQVVEAVKPGDFVYVKGGQLQVLAGSADGFTPTTRPTSIEDETDNSNWTFGVDAQVPLPHTVLTDPLKASLKANGAGQYTVTFTDTSVTSLAPAADQSPIDSYAQARKRAQQYLDVLSVRDAAANAKGSADDGQVWLVTQTLNAGVDYRFSGSGGFSPDVSVPLKAVTAQVQGSGVDETTRTVSFAGPLPIAFRSLPLAVEVTAQQGPPRVTVQGDGYAGPKVMVH